MDISAFCTQSRILIVAGKGGVGKTTMAATLSRLAADSGLSVLVIELEGRPGLTSAFGHGGVLDYDGSVLTAAGAWSHEKWESGPSAAGGHEPMSDPHDEDVPIPKGTVRARMITPDDALLEYLADHGLRRVSKRLVSSGVIDVVAGAIPGIRDILVLGKIKQIERSANADLIIVDAPATGHAMTFLSSASGLLDAARGGPIRTQAAEVVELLTDPSRCQVALVTLAEEMPVNEVIDTAYQLEDKVGVALGPVIVNGWYEPLDGLSVPTLQAAESTGISLDPSLVEALEAARSFRSIRERLQHVQGERLARELPLPQLRAPFLFTPVIGPGELHVLASALAAGIRALPHPPEASA